MRAITRPECPDPIALRTDYKVAVNKEALRQASFDKCMYCESKVTHTYYGDVEHILPKAKNLFPELEFTWENLGFCCAKCNNAKSNKYNPNIAIINPYNEDPSEHLAAFGSLLLHIRGSERGEFTILVTDLNRDSLKEQRAHHLNQVQNAVDKCYRTHDPALRALLFEALWEEAAPDKQFSIFAEALLKTSIT
ncbi:HNH endonuclease [Pseudomonas bharatica]|uniref:HNH endonuclease n=1 Tax=Pseudomonas bharatica TaxID=2692112 RepID=UPI003B284364